MELWSKKVLIKSSPYTVGEVLFESAVAGTYSVDLAANGNYEVYVIGAGAPAGNVEDIYGDVLRNGGGSGSGFIGVVELTKGTYPITVGKAGTYVYGNGTTEGGGDSSISDAVIAYGGAAVNTGASGRGGAIPTINVPIISETLNVAGNNGGSYYTGKMGSSDVRGGASVYGGYGKGGAVISNVRQLSTDGYVKIVYVGG